MCVCFNVHARTSDFYTQLQRAGSSSKPFIIYFCLKHLKTLAPRLLFQLATHCQHRALTGYVNSHAAALTCLRVTVLCCVVCYKNCSKLFHFTLSVSVYIIIIILHS